MKNIETHMNEIRLVFIETINKIQPAQVKSERISVKTKIGELDTVIHLRSNQLEKHLPEGYFSVELEIFEDPDNWENVGVSQTRYLGAWNKEGVKFRSMNHID